MLSLNNDLRTSVSESFPILIFFQLASKEYLVVFNNNNETLAVIIHPSACILRYTVSQSVQIHA